MDQLNLDTPPETKEEKKPDAPAAPPKSGSDWASKAQALRDKARKAGVTRRNGRPVGSGKKGNDGGDRGDPAGVAKLPSPAGGGGALPAVDVGALLCGGCMDALQGYRELGYFVTGHEHWRDLSPQRLEAGARCMGDILAKATPAVQASVLQGLIWLRVLAVGGEVVVSPVLASWKLHKDKKLADAQPKPGDNGGDSGPGQ